jgi:predicted nucleotidyltransferase
MARSFEEATEIANRVVALVHARFPVRAAYLFGSYVEGNPRDDSDIDIAIFADGVAALGIEEKMQFLSDIQRQTSNDVELHLFSSEAFAECRPTNFWGYIASHGKSLAA